MRGETSTRLVAKCKPTPSKAKAKLKPTLAEVKTRCHGGLSEVTRRCHRGLRLVTLSAILVKSFSGKHRMRFTIINILVCGNMFIFAASKLKNKSNTQSKWGS